ncbi:maturation protein [ssRNA phage Gerhypos.4_46]|uniref:Maturation protein n=2 Tax=Leviviricetes TaxID=2842243 RepID=A0A8S5KXT6_9VIRU|nr:maturation protein [ssRNA phage Gerhypos.4_46]QDH86853.1 MAG: hypothetical protein H4Bulk46782_000001 [Leviviridae sp.]DAD50201.1 TPA_asm: maturation protein [ssRNA phage Gerhypos.4_46]
MVVAFFFPRRRVRDTFSDGLTGQSRGSTFGAWVPYDQPGQINEECIDSVHPFDPRGRATRGDVGGPFELTRTETTYGSTYSLNNSLCVGTVGAKGYSGWLARYNGTSMISVSSLQAWSATAVARSTPTSPVSGLATFLGELRSDGLPHIPGSEARATTLSARSAGSEYLNVEFGWLPFISDIRKFAFAVKNSKEIIDDYRKGSDTKIRVRYGGQGDSSSLLSSGSGFASPSNLNIPTFVNIDERTETSRKFSGAFRYHIPMGNSQYDRLVRYEAYANRLVGSRITPEVLWEVAPWSWAVDWFTNTGDVIHNISSLGSDGLVMQYGYATDVVRYTADLRARVTSTQAGVPVNTFLSRFDERKYIRRIQATPYGFGLDWDGFSPRQIGVLVALGLTRGQRPGYRGRDT